MILPRVHRLPFIFSSVSITTTQSGCTFCITCFMLYSGIATQPPVYGFTVPTFTLLICDYRAYRRAAVEYFQQRGELRRIRDSEAGLDRNAGRVFLFF